MHLSLATTACKRSGLGELPVSCAPLTRRVWISVQRNAFSRLQKFMIFGKSGWIGGLLGEILTKQGANWEYATARMEDRAALIADIERVRHPAPQRRVTPAPRV